MRARTDQEAVKPAVAGLTHAFFDSTNNTSQSSAVI